MGYPPFRQPLILQPRIGLPVPARQDLGLETLWRGKWGKLYGSVCYNWGPPVMVCLIVYKPH